MKVFNPTIGTDFELFLRDDNTKEIISAEGYIQGTKDEPFVCDPENRYFATSLDNVLAEATIPPVTNAGDFYRFIQKSMEYLRNQIPHEISLVATPAAYLHERWLQTDNAKRFGCEPDYCVWTRSVNEPPCAVNANLRSAGGHIHIGYDKPNMETNEEIIKAMDLFVGVPSVLQEPDNDRKNLYGKAGCFRFKDYGIEYRTVSNYYLVSKELTEWVFNNTLAAIEFVNSGEAKETFGGEFDNEAVLVQQAINQNDKRMAEWLIKEFGIKLVA